MPTYEFRCPAGHRFEKFYPQITSKRTERCPKCGKRATRLVSGGAGIVFKGSGFYATDYKRAGEKKESGGESKPSGESKSPGDSKSSGSSRSSSDK